jgi:hypothetical protein
MDPRHHRSSGPTLSALLILGAGAFMMNPAPATAAMAHQPPALTLGSIEAEGIAGGGSPGAVQWFAQGFIAGGHKLAVDHGSALGAGQPRAGASDSRFDLAPVRLGPFVRPTDGFALSAGVKLKF